VFIFLETGRLYPVIVVILKLTQNIIMEHRIFGFNFSKIEIPVVFYDSITGKPFSVCNICNCDLIKDSWSYVIEKVYRRNMINGKMEVFFEYAICYDCVQKLVERYSKESLQRIQDYFDSHISNSKSYFDQSRVNNEEELMGHLSKCSLSGKPVEELDEYQMAAMFTGNHINLMMPPYIFGGEALDSVSDLLSEKTIGEIDDFIGDYLTGPPEFRDMFKSPRHRPILI
jgi:hypothetical protein